MEWGTGDALAPGRYRIRGGTADAELEVGPTWAAMRAFAGDAAAADRLRAAGFAPPQPRATSASARGWFRSWSRPAPDDLREATSALVGDVGATLELERRPGYEGDPRAPIGVVLGAAYLAYALVANWAVLTLWDDVFPSRAHPASAIWAQVVGPAVAFALFAAYVTILPRWRLARAAAHRPPTPQEVDLVMPALSLVGLLLPPIVLLVLLLLTAQG
jgi:hypothetical protein